MSISAMRISIELSALKLHHLYEARTTNQSLQNCFVYEFQVLLFFFASHDLWDSIYRQFGEYIKAIPTRKKISLLDSIVHRQWIS